MKKLLIIVLLGLTHQSKSQKIDSSFLHTSTAYKMEFIYADGIKWSENKKQDSIKQIFIEGDTMTAVRNLLVYCTQEKNEGDAARIVLSMLRLDVIGKIIKRKDFDYWVKQYKKIVAKNIKDRPVFTINH